MSQKLGILILIILMPFISDAQSASVDSSLVQFSGMVLDGSGEKLMPLPYVTVAVKKKGRGTYSNYRGFFSLVVQKGDVIIFTSIGYKAIEYTVPDTLKGSRLTVVQLLSTDAVNLPETVIFPWPSANNFKNEFLAMDVTEEMHERAKANLAQKRINDIRSSLAMDGNENNDYYLRQEAQSFYHIGQTPPMNIFNPMKWKEFFEAWKDGKFKNE